MATIIRRNERSWAIDLISKINAIATANDLIIKRAGGESTISTGRGNTMFPDVVLYGNKEQSIILQGWELKCRMSRLRTKPLLKMHSKRL